MNLKMKVVRKQAFMMVKSKVFSVEAVGALRIARG
jgi:hypothetical protein